MTRMFATIIRAAHVIRAATVRERLPFEYNHRFFTSAALTAIWAAVLTFAPQADAHVVDITRVDATFERDGAFRVVVYYDVDAWLAGMLPEHLTAAAWDEYKRQPAADQLKRDAELVEFLKRFIKVRFDDKKVDYDIDYAPWPFSEGDVPHADMVRPRRCVELLGRAPDGAKAFVLQTSRTFGNIILTLRRADASEEMMRIEKGGRSRAFEFASAGPQPDSALAVTWLFLVLGFEHILPLGWDHIAFVVGLFLLSHRWKPLLWQVTAFTLAHSVTLSLAALGYVRVGDDWMSGVVEPFIALSIAYVAIENIFTTRLKPWRPMVVFLFGLVHGLGFASVLLDLGIPPGHYVNALVSFNVGVELGQIAVIAIAFALVGWFRNRAWYRARVVIPASAAIGLLGLYVAVDRFMS